MQAEIQETQEKALGFKIKNKKKSKNCMARQTPGQVAKRSSGVLTLRDIQNPPTHIPV